MSNKTVLGIFWYAGITGNQSILGSDIEGVVNFPVNISYFSGWMEEALRKTDDFLVEIKT